MCSVCWLSWSRAVRNRLRWDGGQADRLIRIGSCPAKELTMNNDVEPTSVNGLEPYESPELTVVGEFGEVTKGNYSRPNSDDSDAGGYWSP